LEIELSYRFEWSYPELSWGLFFGPFAGTSSFKVSVGGMKCQRSETEEE